MDVICRRRRHMLQHEFQDIVLCCNHSNKYFIDFNGIRVNHSSQNFCKIRCTRSSTVYIFVCKICFQMFQNKSVSLFAVNYAWIKHYIDREDIESVQLNGLYRFCSLEETKSGAYFKVSQYKVIF